jgi:3-oxoacyl-[acyl-carrier protein] reductase
MRDLRGANVILTGGSRGIGPYIARALAREGANVALAARDGQQLDTVRGEIEALGVRAVAVPADITKAGDRERLVARGG